jgi:hypothetical protein
MRRCGPLDRPFMKEGYHSSSEFILIFFGAGEGAIEIFFIGGLSIRPLENF